MERKHHDRKNKTRLHIAVAALSVTVVMAGICGGVFFTGDGGRGAQEELLVRYMEQIERQDYEEMYRMTDPAHSAYADKEAFIKRNSAIYEGIEVKDIRVEITEHDRKKNRKNEGEPDAVAYRMSFDTIAGRLHLDNEMYFTDTENGYKILWNDGLIFPELTSEDKVRIEPHPAVRGKILDRNDRMLAGQGTASSVGLVPGKLADRETAFRQLSELLDMDSETIRNCLDASWVKEDSFVPVKTIPKVSELDLMALKPREKVLAEKARQDALLAIPGVMISDVEVRTYPFGAAAGHLTGYVGNVTAEDLEEHAGEGYSENSVIGRSGLEGLFEKELKGMDGCSIYIERKDGRKKSVLANLPVQNGQDIRLTIDAQLQESLYEQFREDPGCSAAMDPYSGEVLALVSTPSFDSNDFILGLSDARWNSLNEDERKPLLNRFRQIWCPGSTFKPVIAAIGLKTGTVSWQEDFGNVGLSWQKDDSWGDYYVTTLHAYEPVTMENALIYSDNIYFAKAALKIGADALERELNTMGFGEQMPFDIEMPPSQFSNAEHIESEIQLADSGYGQGQVLVNPLHMASLYTAFCNEGNVLKPRLVYEKEAGGNGAGGGKSAGSEDEEHETEENENGTEQSGNTGAEIWLPQIFSGETAAQVLEGMKKVVNNPEGTGYAAHREDIVLAGKTGTAEIKTSVEDTEGTEIGWFAVFTAEKDAEDPLLIVSMVENVKEIGGSGYVVHKDRSVLDAYWGSGQHN